MSESKKSEQEALRKQFKLLLTSRFSILELKVLLALAYGDPANRYQLKKEIKYTYPAVHGAMKNLEKLGCVKVVSSGRSKKNHPMNFYGLTVEGLLWLLSRQPKALYPSFIYHPRFGLKKTPEEKDIEELKKPDQEKDVYLQLFLGFDFDSVAKKKASLLPTVLNEWKRLKELDSADELVWHFPGVAFETLKEYYLGSEGLRTRFTSMEKIFAYKLFYRYLEKISKPYRIREPSPARATEARLKEYVMQKAVKALTSSPELMNLAEQILNDLKTETNWRSTFIEGAQAKIAYKKNHEHAT